MSESPDKNRIFKPGKIELHFPASRRNDSFLSKPDAAVLTEKANRKEVLRKNFIDIVPLYKREIRGGMVQIMSPSSPYAYGGVMVLAAEDSLIHPNDTSIGDELLETKSLFDYEPAVQVEYYKQILASIMAEEDIVLPRLDENSQVVAYENTMASISNAKHRLPRTIALPHAHVIKGGDWIDESFAPVRPYGFKLEQRILQDKDLFVKFENRWRELMPERDTCPRIQMRESAPYGYTIDCDATRTLPLDEQSQKLAHILSVHHSVYSMFVAEEIRETDGERHEKRHEFAQIKGMKIKDPQPLERALLLQPSYRTFIYYEDNRLLVSISPIFLACVGGLEAMDAMVDRSTDHIRHFSDDELRQFSDSLTSHLSKLLNPKKPADSQDTATP